MSKHNVEVRHRWSIGYIWLLLQVQIIRNIVRLIKYFSSQGKNSSSAILKKHHVKRQSTTIPSRQPGRTIKLHIYTPLDNKFIAEKRPVHVNWHGSGFVMPLLGDDITFCAFLSAALQITVIDADYRKAPEYPFPSCIQDSEDVMLYTLAHSAAWNADKVTISGFSAGGNIALGQASNFGSRIRAVIAVYPPADFRDSRDRRAPESCKGALPKFLVDLFDRSYIVPPQSVEDPLLSVVVIDPNLYPSVLFVSTGRGDTLYNEGKKIIDRAVSAKHPDATFKPIEGVAHAWDKSVSGTTEVKRNLLYDEISDAIKRSWEA